MPLVKIEPTLLVFYGSIGGSPVEEAFSRVQETITLDLLDRAKFTSKILATNSYYLAETAKKQAIVEICGSPFHFGQSLRRLINKYKIAAPFYIGGGFPLLTASEIENIANLLQDQESCVISNNFYSADMVAFTPGSSIDIIELPEEDNPLARLLVEQAGLRFIPLTRSVSNQFDVDTPTDLLLLGLHPCWKGIVQGNLNMDDSRLRAAMACFRDKKAEVLVFGRVNSHVWSRLESQTQCRIRLWAEERGLKSEGRLESKKARSLAGFLLEKMDFHSFFNTLAQMADAAFIDSRVLFAHFNLSVSRKDRFYSDMGNFREIENAFVREFTRASVESSIPVVLGGHSLVSGGMLLLLELMPDKL